jgi:integrase
LANTALWRDICRSHADRAKPAETSVSRRQELVVVSVSPQQRRSPEGIVIRHSRGCASRSGAGGCDCRPGYQAQVFSPRDRRTIRKTFKTLAEARAWRAEAQLALRRGTLRAPTKTTLEEAAALWLKAAKAGVIRTSTGETYKPSALRGYEEALRTKILPELGHLRLSAITRNSIQDLIDRLLAQGLAPSTVRNVQFGLDKRAFGCLP